MDKLFFNIVTKTIADIWEDTKMGAKIEELKNEIKGLVDEINPKKPEPKKTNPVVIVLAVIGAIAAVAAIAYAVYYFLIPEDSEDFEDLEDFEDFDDFSDSDLEGDE